MIKNAKIEGTFLGREDHGIMTAFINIDYGDSGHQGFGGYTFDEYDKKKERRVGHSFGMDFIIGVLEVLEVDKWEDLIGIYCRVDADRGKVHKIGHITKDKWFDPSGVLP